MKSFEGRFDDRLTLTHELVRTVRSLGEYRGRAELYRAQMPQVLETLRAASMIQSVESSNRIEGVTAPPKRLREIMAEKTGPRDRSEQEIAGYRDVLASIHANHGAMKMSPNLVLQLERDLFKYTDTVGGRWKSAQNSISERRPDGTEYIRFEPVEPYLVEEYMNRLQSGFDALWNAGEVDRLLLIPAYVLDFLCIHPFPDGNGRMARLLTTLLLYKAGYEVGRFVSLERVIEESKESYYEALRLSSIGWHEGKHDLAPWTGYLLGTFIAAYREFESRVGAMTGGRGAKTEMVTDAIDRFVGDFSVAELQAACPNVGIDLIRRLLAKGQAAGILECLGRGPAARWRRK